VKPTDGATMSGHTNTVKNMNSPTPPPEPLRTLGDEKSLAPVTHRIARLLKEEVPW